MRTFFAIALITAGLSVLLAPGALADDQSSSDQGSSGQMSGSSDQGSSDQAKPGDYGYGSEKRDISGHSISDEAQDREPGRFGATTTRPSGESVRERLERRMANRENVKNYSERDLESLKPDERFLVTDYQDNLFEIKAGRLVADQARSDEVRRFARTIANDHRKANDKIRDLAERRNVDLPDRVAPWQQAMLDHMSQLRPIELGRKYVFHQVGMHNVNILEHQWVANHVRDRDIRELAERMTTDLEHHLEVACSLATRLSEAAEGQASANR
jgi:putative membrane protein